MATRLEDEFDPTRINAPDSAYPAGSLKDETTPGVSDDGTPLISRVGNDWQGFSQSALDKAGIAANGQPDSVSNPQILQAIEQMYNDGDSQIAGDPIWPLSSQESAQDGDDLTGYKFVRINGGDFPSLKLFRLTSKDGNDTTPSGSISTINLSSKPYDCQVGGVDFYLGDASKEIGDVKFLFASSSDPDSTDVINSVIDLAGDYGVVTSSSAEVYNASNVTINKPLTFKNVNLKSNSTDTVTIAARSSGITIDSCVVDVNNLNLPYDQPSLTQDAGIELYSPSVAYDNFTVNNCTVINAGRDCIYINTVGGGGHVITGNRLLGATRNCISIVSSTSTIMSNNTVKDWGLLGVDFENNPGTPDVVYNTSFTENTLYVNELSFGAAIAMRTADGLPASTTTDVIVSGNIVIGNPLNSSAASTIRNTGFINVIIKDNIIKDCAAGITSNMDAVITGNTIRGRNAHTETTLSSQGAITSSGIISGNTIVDYPFFGIIGARDFVSITNNTIKNVGAEVFGMSSIYLYDSLGTFDTCVISNNSMIDSDRGIHFRNLTNVKSSTIGNTFTNINTITVGSTTNYNVRLDQEGLRIDGDWDSGPMRFDTRVEWYDSTGNKRAKNGTPTSETDGVIISQNPVT